MTTARFSSSLAVVIGIDDYGHGVPALRTASLSPEDCFA